MIFLLSTLKRTNKRLVMDMKKMGSKPPFTFASCIEGNGR